MFLLDEKFETNGVCVHQMYIFELSSRTDKITPLVLTPVSLKIVLECQEGQALAGICILSKRISFL